MSHRPWNPRPAILISAALIVATAGVIGGADMRVRPTAGRTFVMTGLESPRLRAFADRVRAAFAKETRFEDGCEERAHLIAEAASLEGIVAGKIFIQKNLPPVKEPRSGHRVQWYHHVAALFTDDHGRAYVIDPFFDDPLIPLGRWADELSTASDARLSGGALKYRGKSGTLAVTPGYFFTRPDILSDQLISETVKFDPYERAKAKKAYPAAAAELGL